MCLLGVFILPIRRGRKTVTVRPAWVPCSGGSVSLPPSAGLSRVSLTGGHRHRLAAQGVPGPEEQPAAADGPDLGSPGQSRAQTGCPDLRLGASSISGLCHGLTSTRTLPCFTFKCLGPPAGVSVQPGMLGGHSWLPKLCRLELILQL